MRIMSILVEFKVLGAFASGLGFNAFESCFDWALLSNWFFTLLNHIFNYKTENLVGLEWREVQQIQENSSSQYIFILFNFLNQVGTYFQDNKIFLICNCKHLQFHPIFKSIRCIDSSKIDRRVCEETILSVVIHIIQFQHASLFWLIVSGTKIDYFPRNL